MTRQPQGRDKVFSQANVRAWMRMCHLPGQGARELARAAAQAFDVGELLAGLEEGDHWIFDLAADALERHQVEVRACRAAAEAEMAARTGRSA